MLEYGDGVVFVSSDAERVDRAFVQEGYKWGGGFGTGGGTVTWSVAEFNFGGRWTYDFTLDGIGFDAGALIRQAFAEWASVADISFVEVGDASDVDIRFGLSNTDGPFGTLGIAHTTFSGQTIQFVDVHYDPAEAWTEFSGGSNVSFYAVTLHEIGHALGLDHEDDEAAVMNSLQESFGFTINSLQSDDIAGIQSIYGAAVANLAATEGNDFLNGSAAAENISALGGDDWVVAGGGDDVIRGNAGNDVIYGNTGNDIAYGNMGDDRIFGGQDFDRIFGGQQNDVIYGNLQDDVVYGNLGDDWLYGGQDQDVLYGGQDNDVLLGNLGDDDLWGNLGDDWLFGNAGFDFFIFGNNSGNDVIGDYNTFQDLVWIASNANGSGITDVAGALSRLSDSASGALLDLGGGNTVLFDGLTVADLGSDDFAIF